MDHNLRRMITALGIEPLLKDLAHAMDAAMRVEDPDGLEILSLGHGGTPGHEAHDVVLDGGVLGRVRGGPAARVMADLLAHMASRERGGSALRAAHDRVCGELALLAQLQKKLLPRDLPDLPGMTVLTAHHPTGLGSGDACDHFPVPGKGLRAMVADVAGHGARAAFVMAMVQTLFRVTEDIRTDEFRLDLADTIILMNHRLRQIFVGERDFVTMFAFEADRERGLLRYVNAGHCPGLLRTGDGIRRLEAMTPPLGFFELDLTPEQVSMPPGSGLLVFTDGLYEWELPDGQGYFGLERFWDLAAQAVMEPGFAPQALADRLQGLGWPPGRHDDATLFWLEFEDQEPA